MRASRQIIQSKYAHIPNPTLRHAMVFLRCITAEPNGSDVRQYFELARTICAGCDIDVETVLALQRLEYAFRHEEVLDAANAVLLTLTDAT